MNHHPDGAQRPAGHPRDLPVRHAVYVTQDGRRAVAIGQLAERREQGGGSGALAEKRCGLIDDLGGRDTTSGLRRSRRRRSTADDATTRKSQVEKAASPRY